MLCIILRYGCFFYFKILFWGFWKWNGLFFKKSSLHNAGLHIQLGHGGASCISPKWGPLAFTVVDVSGIHLITIDFCNRWQVGSFARLSSSHHWLLRLPDEWNCSSSYPTLMSRLVSFYFQLSSNSLHISLSQFLSWLNAYDFCWSLLRLTDSLELNKTSVCFFHQD